MGTEKGLKMVNQWDLIELISDHIWGIRGLILATYDLGSCIHSSVIISEVINHYGGIAYPLDVRVVGNNPPKYEK